MSLSALSFGTPFFEYLDNHLMPILSGSINIIIIILSLVGNGVLLRMFRKLQVLREVSFYNIIYHMIAIDIIACIFTLIPTIISNFAKTLLFTIYGCYAHAFFVTLVYCANMFGLVVFSLERVYRITDPDGKHAHFFKSKVKIKLSFALVWVFAIFIAVSSVIPITTIDFLEEQYQCNIDHNSNLYYMMGLCFASFLLPFLIGLIAQCAAAAGMSKQLKQDIQSLEANPPAETSNAKQSKRERRRAKRLSTLKTASNTEQVASIFDADDNTNPDHNLSVTLLIIWFCTAVFSVPYWTHWFCAFASYLNPPGPTLYRSTWLSSVFILNLSFCIKPLLFISHCKMIKRDVKKSFSKELRNKVKNAMKTATAFVDKVDKVVSKPLARAKAFENTVLAKRYARQWIEKARAMKQAAPHSTDPSYIPDSMQPDTRRAVRGSNRPVTTAAVIEVAPSPVPSSVCPYPEDLPMSAATVRNVTFADVPRISPTATGEAVSSNTASSYEMQKLSTIE